MSTNANFLDGSYASVIIQVTLSCNMRCKHCYEAGQNYCESKMSIETVEKIIRFYVTNYKKVDFNWFGGEPLLLGIDFYKKVLEFEKKYAQGTIIRNYLQTNGVLCTGEILKFLLENKFIFSFSYDGFYNNVLREQTSIVESRMKEAKQLGYIVPVICVVTNKNIGHLIDIYEDFKSKNIPFQLNPIFKMKNSNTAIPYLMNDEEYLDGFKKLFEHWLYDKNGPVFTPLAKYVLTILGSSKGRICELVGCLYKWVSIDPNGNIFNCTRFSDEDFKITNINEVNKISDIYETQKYEEIVKKSIIRRKNCKSKCNLYLYCNGGANCHAYNENGSLLNSDTQLCRFVKGFFPYLIKRLDEIVENNQLMQINKWIRIQIINSRKYGYKFVKENK